VPGEGTLFVMKIPKTDKNGKPTTNSPQNNLILK
jgi:hypothetical protein